MSLRCRVIRHLTSWLHCIQHPENISLTQWQELHQDVWIIPKLCCAAIERRLNAVQSWTTKGNDCIISLVWKQHKSSTDKSRRHLHIFVLHVVVVLQDCWDALLLLWDLLILEGKHCDLRKITSIWTTIVRISDFTVSYSIWGKVKE